MASTRKTPGNTGKDADELAEELALTPEEREEEDTEAVIAAEFGQGDNNVTWAVKVWRAAAKGEPEPYLFTCSPNELPIIDRLRDEYGTGTYRVRVFKNNRVYRYFTVVVEAKRPPQNVPAQTLPQDNLSAVVSQALDRQTVLIERLLSERPRNTGQSIDAMSMISTMLTALSSFKEVFAPQQTNNQSSIDLFLKGIEAARDLGGGGEKGESSMVDVVRDLLKSPLVEKMLETATMPQMPTSIPLQPRAPGIGELPPAALQPTPQPNYPQPGGNNDAEQQQGIPQVNQNQAMEVLHNLKYLATKAASNADVDLYVDWVMDNVPADILKQFINDPNTLPMILQTVPEAAPYQAWFAQLLAGIKETLTEEVPADQNMGHV